MKKTDFHFRASLLIPLFSKDSFAGENQEAAVLPLRYGKDSREFATAAFSS